MVKLVPKLRIMNNLDNFIIRMPRMKKNENIDQFMEKFEKMADFYKWNDQQKATIFTGLVKMNPDINSIVERLSKTEQKSFRSIKLAIWHKWKHNKMDNIVELMSIKRCKHESIGQLNQRIKALIEKIYPNFETSQKMEISRNHLFNALRPKIREKIYSFKFIPKTSDHLAAIVENINCPINLKTYNCIRNNCPNCSINNSQLKSNSTQMNQNQILMNQIEQIFTSKLFEKIIGKN